MFVHLEQRHKPRLPWVTLGLVVLYVASFVALDLSDPRTRIDAVLRWGVMPGSVFGTDRVLRLVTAQFIHADWLHLIGNMVFLLIFGLPTERALRWRRYLLLVVLAGAFANLVGALTISDDRAVIVGCSGAVSALVGAYLGLFPRAHLGVVLPLGLYFEFVRVPVLLLIGIWILFQLAFTWVGPSFSGVIWWIHIAGFLAGLAFALLSRPALARRRRSG